MENDPGRGDDRDGLAFQWQVDPEGGALFLIRTEAHLASQVMLTQQLHAKGSESPAPALGCK